MIMGGVGPTGAAAAAAIGAGPSHAGAAASGAGPSQAGPAASDAGQSHAGPAASGAGQSHAGAAPMANNVGSASAAGPPIPPAAITPTSAQVGQAAPQMVTTQPQSTVQTGNTKPKANDKQAPNADEPWVGQRLF